MHLSAVRGEPEEVVRSVAAKVDADLVVLMSHHVGDPVEPLLAASITRRIVRVAHRPTLMIPTPSGAGVATGSTRTEDLPARM